MSVVVQLDLLEREFTGVGSEVDRLIAKDAIRDCVHRVFRGLDRIDEMVLRSAFHHDAVVDFRPSFQGPLDEWIGVAIKHQRAQLQAHHMAGSSLIQVDGDSAVAETYALARHKNQIGGQWFDLIIGLRALDRFTKRNSEWKISEHKQIVDWARNYPVTDANELVYANGPLENGTRDLSDPSYRFLR